MVYPFEIEHANPRVVVLRGLFQHPSYFEPALERVRDGVLKKLHERFESARGADGSVAVHFRRGDYLRPGFCLPLSFQTRALAEVAQRAAVNDVSVTSDDPDFAELAAEHFTRLGYPATARSGSQWEAELDDLCALAGARHLVMSNSTWAWWAAVLGDGIHARTDRVVVCPCPWMPAAASERVPPGLDFGRPGWISYSWDT
jgi:hypothetical protein